MTLFEILKKTGLPCSYSHFRGKNPPSKPPYLVYLGAGQNTLSADNTYPWRRNRYSIEYYFTKKDEAKETEIEDLLLEHGYQYDKSEDVYIEDEGVFVIYYNV